MRSRRWAVSKIVTIRSGSFLANVTADGFIRLGVRRIKKLAWLMAAEPRENQEAVDAIREVFRDSIDTAKKKWELARLTYQSEYIAPKFTLARADLIDQHNQKLLNDVKKAKRAYDTLIKKKEIFEKEIT